ncbi:Rhodanese domain-containing protein [Legionella quinlivanii]|uniref:Rhodanese domain-containing protein n=1 Tax=Legionella quinlivanii TaxID=45073 RepID=A0A0W0Y0Q0_9GAMM|nr:rhodanese-like domain-containing protein [Legionella quinlivanii]KTD50288.1 Rhodanese domain-containing protein [Legionella quinlivanii]SEF44575.1 Rhodanese-related sulfurtransferase [Legionella quinlivanii DSM 21216]STY11888.1 rhodanese domain-containing protein [Legionella quinlivanii]
MNEHNIATIDVHELKQRMEKNSKLCLIDVREDYEWQNYRIPQALHIPKGELAARIQEEVADTAEPIYLHCQGGVRSLAAAETLMQMGYQEVYSVNGGIAGWSMAGYPIEK